MVITSSTIGAIILILAKQLYFNNPAHQGFAGIYPAALAMGAIIVSMIIALVPGYWVANKFLKYLNVKNEVNNQITLLSIILTSILLDYFALVFLFESF